MHCEPGRPSSKSLPSEAALWRTTTEREGSDQSPAAVAPLMPVVVAVPRMQLADNLQRSTKSVVKQAQPSAAETEPAPNPRPNRPLMSDDEGSRSSCRFPCYLCVRPSLQEPRRIPAATHLAGHASHAEDQGPDHHSCECLCRCFCRHGSALHWASSLGALASLPLHGTARSCRPEPLRRPSSRRPPSWLPRTALALCVAAFCAEQRLYRPLSQ
mmetsp:Transcript_47334/g.112583  ORF Transcript_47334/g.112583 Transcript_47334/m.112583 type:complete len:214 (-) Transcript_47334:371-1012(-)